MAGRCVCSASRRTRAGSQRLAKSKESARIAREQKVEAWITRWRSRQNQQSSGRRCGHQMTSPDWVPRDRVIGCGLGGLQAAFRAACAEVAALQLTSSPWRHDNAAWHSGGVIWRGWSLERCLGGGQGARSTHFRPASGCARPRLCMAGQLACPTTARWELRCCRAARVLIGRGVARPRQSPRNFQDRLTTRGGEQRRLQRLF